MILDVQLLTYVDPDGHNFVLDIFEDVRGVALVAGGRAWRHAVGMGKLGVTPWLWEPADGTSSPAYATPILPAGAEHYRLTRMPVQEVGG